MPYTSTTAQSKDQSRALPFDILVITDRITCQGVGRSLGSVLMALLQSPLSPRMAILLREKTLPQPQVAEMLLQLLPRVREAGARLLVHSYPHLALDLGLDGFHLAANAPKLVLSQDSNLLIGVSRHHTDSLDETDIGFADYATMSPIYRPTSKPQDPRQPLGLTGLKICCQRSLKPLVALGGLQPGRVAAVMAQGAAAIAVSGAILQADDPVTLLKQLCEEVDQHRNS